jgi:flagellar capping protein FliD
MATISLPGLVTGIDTKQLISQLMAVEQKRLNLYQQRKTGWDNKKVAVSDVESKLQLLRNQITDLSDADKLRAFKTASSDTDILTAETSNNAFEGNHTIEINQLATAARLVHSDGIKYAEDYVSPVTPGTFIYSYNHNETAITTTETTTLEELVDLINNDANNPGVTASLLSYNDMYHLVLSGNDAGSDYEISINESNTEVWQSQSPFTVDGEDATLSTKIADLDQFSEIFVEDGYITISGNKHGEGATVSRDFTINENTKLGHLIEEINDAFGGTATATLVNGEIRLTDNSCGTSYMELDLTYYAPSDPPTQLLDISIDWLTKGGTVSNSLDGFNQSDDFANTQQAQDSKIRVDGYPSGAWISRSSNTVDDVIAGVTLHLHDTGTVQVTLTRDIDSVKQKLNSMVSAYNSVVSSIKEKTGYDEDSKTAGVLMGDYTVSDIQSRLYMPFISRASGFIEDINTFLMPGQIGFKFDKDGVLSLDSTALDEAIAKNYMDVLAVIGAAKTGSSNSNTIGFYAASDKYTTAGTYDVKVIVDGENKSAWIKLSTEPESAYRLATIDGNMITGNSRFNDNGDPVYPENGLQLTADLSQSGTATVRVKQGFAGALEDALDKLLKATNGPLDIDQEQIADNIKSLQDKIDLEQTRLDKKQERLTAKYARLEKTLTLLQNQMAALGLSG